MYKYWGALKKVKNDIYDEKYFFQFYYKTINSLRNTYYWTEWLCATKQDIFIVSETKKTTDETKVYDVASNW